MSVFLTGYNKAEKDIVGLATTINDLDELPELIRQFMQTHPHAVRYKVEVNI